MTIPINIGEGSKDQMGDVGTRDTNISMLGTVSTPGSLVHAGLPTNGLGLQSAQNGMTIAPIGAPAVQSTSPSVPLLAPHPPSQPTQLLAQPLQNRLHSLTPITPAVPQQQVLPAAMAFPHPPLPGALHMQIPMAFLPPHPDPVALMNASKTTQTPPVFQNRKLRSGKWTDEEEQYADLLIELFEKGHIEEKNGCTLRSFLSRKLHCAPMRISKKYAGKGIGKMVFLSKKTMSGYHGISAAALATSAARLRDAETRFYKAVLPDSATSKFDDQTTAGQLVHHTPPLLNGLTPIVPATSIAPASMNFVNNQSGAIPGDRTAIAYPLLPHQMQFSAVTDNAMGAPIAMMHQRGAQAAGNSFFIQPGNFPGILAPVQPGAQAIMTTAQPGPQSAVQLSSLQPAPVAPTQSMGPQPIALPPRVPPHAYSHQALPPAAHVPENPSLVNRAFSGTTQQAISESSANIVPASVSQENVTQPKLTTAHGQNLSQHGPQSEGASRSDAKPTSENKESSSASSDPSSLLEPSDLLSHHARQLHQTYLSVLENMSDDENPEEVEQMKKVAPLSEKNDPNSDLQTQHGDEHASQPRDHSASQSTSVNSASMTVNPSNHEMPDFLSGFDKVTAASGGNQIQTSPSQGQDQYSPPFTSRSFDDFHRFLGNLSPLATAKTSGNNPAGHAGVFSPGLAMSPTSRQAVTRREVPVGPPAAQVSNGVLAPQQQQRPNMQQTTLPGSSKPNSSGVAPNPFGADAYNMFAQQSAFAASQHSAYTPQWRTLGDHTQNAASGSQQSESGQVPMTAGLLDCRRGQASNVVSEPSNASGSTGGSSSESGGDNASDNAANDSDGASSESSVRKKMRLSYNQGVNVQCEESATN